MRKQHVQLVSEAIAQSVRARLEEAGFTVGPADHAYFDARAPGLRVTAYRSGKLMFQGAKTEEWVARLGPLIGEPSANDGASIGSDESGKGDYFGSLVVAACCVAPEDVAWLRGLGVRDSKTAGAREIREAAHAIVERLPHAVREFEPKDYNRLHAECGNVNRILGDAHAAVIRDLREKTGARHAIVDRFGGEHYVRDALGAAAKGLKLDQVPRAEAHPAVAAASFLARDRFVRSLERLSQAIGFRLLPGASDPAERCARQLVRERGADVLAQVAKVHFKTTQKILPRPWDGIGGQGDTDPAGPS